MNHEQRRLPRVVFYHIEKTGGTAITEALKRIYPASDVCPEVYGRYSSWLASDLAQFRMFSGHGLYEELQVLPCIDLSFTVLRNPVDRALSFLEYMRYHSDDYAYPDPAIRVSKVLNPDRFFFDAPEKILKRFGNCVVAQLAGTDMWPTSQDLAKAIDRLDKFSFVGIYENLPPFLALLSAALNLPEQLTLQRVNVTRTTRPSNYPLLIEPLPRVVADRIAKINDLDLALYEHAVNSYGGGFPLPPQSIELTPFPSLPTARIDDEIIVTVPNLYVGYMVFGPYARLLPGTYSLDFSLKLEAPVPAFAPDEIVVEFDAYSLSSGRSLARLPVTGNQLKSNAFQLFSLDIQNEFIVSDIEFRAFKHAHGEIIMKASVIMTSQMR